MDIALKQRLVGASVLIALAVVVLPMLFGGRPDPGETGSQRIEVPEQPPELDFETRRFPINTAPAKAEPPPPDEPVSLPTPENSVAEISAAPAPRSEDRAAPDTGAQSLEEAREAPPPGTEQAVAETAEQPVVVVEPDPLPQAAAGGCGRYVVQVASFSSADNARRLSGQLEGQGYAVITDQVKSDAGTLNRVRVGPFETEADADRAVNALQKQMPDIKPRVLDMEPGKAAAVTDAPVATEIHQTLDVHRDFATQVALDFELVDRRTQLRDFRLGQVLDRRSRINAGSLADLLRARVTDTVDRRQRDYDVLVQRYVYACYTCHSISSN